MSASSLMIVLLCPPSHFQRKERNIHASKKLIAVYMVKHSLIFVCKLLYQNVHDFVKRYFLSLLLLAKCADVSTLDTPLPSCQQLSAFSEPLPPSKMLTYFMDGPIVVKLIHLVNEIKFKQRPKYLHRNFP